MQETPIPNSDLPVIPSKRYFTIGEVSELCGVKQHVLRYWEQEFPLLKPMKRRGNRRYYQRNDVMLIRQIRHLLYEEGYTITGARHKLHGGGDESAFAPTTVAAGANMSLEPWLDEIVVQLEMTLVTLRS